METRTALLDAAETLSRRRGFEAFSFAHLSSEIGIRKASIHYHFPTKADLALALISRYASGFLTSLPELDHPASGADMLRNYLNLYRAALDGGQQLCLCIAFSASRASFAPEVLSELSEFRRRSLAWLTHVFGRGAADGTIADVEDPQAEAAAALALAEGAQIFARAESSTDPFDAAISTLTRRLT